MNKWIPCLALALVGCGGGALDGTWKGDAAGWSVTVVLEESVEQGGTTYFSGTVSTNKSACFNNGTATATLVSTSATILSSGAGSASSTAVRLVGELSDDKIVGTLEVIGDAAACTVDRTAITLTRQ